MTANLTHRLGTDSEVQRFPSGPRPLSAYRPYPQRRATSDGEASDRQDKLTVVVRAFPRSSEMRADE
jgi:hypothetical protein